jgi:hypothetical protein
MRGGTRLHPDQARRKSREKRYHLAAPELLPDHDLLFGVDAVDRNTFLAISKPIVVICIWTAPLM